MRYRSSGNQDDRDCSGTGIVTSLVTITVPAPEQTIPFCFLLWRYRISQVQADFYCSGATTVNFTLIFTRFLAPRTPIGQQPPILLRRVLKKWSPHAEAAFLS